MNDAARLAARHRLLTRRHFLELGAAGVAAWRLLPEVSLAGPELGADPLAAAIEKLEYLTRPDDFQTVERGDPIPYTHPIEKLREVGLTRETWKLEVVSDPQAPSRLDSPLTKDKGTALDWDVLMKLAEKHAVRFLKVITCNNLASPLGMGLWEGVPLRVVVWMTQPQADLRRVFYHGYHNDDPKQMFASSLPIGRVLEDPPGEYPVILAYKLNGELLTGKRGGPVRMIVPDAYGFKSVKWLTHVFLSNIPVANDTYIGGNNDIDSWMKTFARILARPAKVKAGEAVPVTGVAQVGISGLSKVQYSLHPQEPDWPADDPNFTKADWKEARVLAPPQNWGGGLAEGKIPAGTIGFDPATGKPSAWPMRYSIVHWAALLTGVAPGKYYLRCRTIDANGIAQPLPRPFPKSGQVNIHQMPLTVESS